MLHDGVGIFVTLMVLLLLLIQMFVDIFSLVEGETMTILEAMQVAISRG
jgi:hypothetical protein